MRSLIVARGQRGEIGKDNQLLWHLPNDLAFFKRMTMDKTIIMGRRTFESLPGVLPKRRHVVLTSSALEHPKVEVVHTLEEALAYEDAFCIGGGKLYEQMLPYCDRLYITEVAANFEADTYFPSFDETLYQKTILGVGKENGLYYEHVLYEKRP